MSEATLSLTLENRDEAVSLFGSRDQYLRLIRDTLGVRLIARGDTIQIEPNSSPGNIVNANVPQLARLTIQGDPSAGRAAIPAFYITDAITLGAAQTGFNLSDVNVGLTDAGSLTFNTNGGLLRTNLVDIDSSALHALTFAGTPDTLSNSTVTGDVALPLGSSLLLVNPGAGSANTITANTFLANAPIEAIAIGRGTNGRAVRRLLEGFEVPIFWVDEFETSRAARSLYFEEHPPVGWRRRYTTPPTRNSSRDFLEAACVSWISRVISRR